MGILRPELAMKSIVPVVMAGILGIYGLVVAVILQSKVRPIAMVYACARAFLSFRRILSA